jgi:hypothetical protein
MTIHVNDFQFPQLNNIAYKGILKKYHLFIQSVQDQWLNTKQEEQTDEISRSHFNQLNQLHLWLNPWLNSGWPW